MARCVSDAGRHSVSETAAWRTRLAAPGCALPDTWLRTWVAPPGPRFDPTLYLRDLSEPNLRLADSYVGLPVRDLGVEFKKERVDGNTDYFRRWHMDIEDRRMMKMIIY